MCAPGHDGPVVWLGTARTHGRLLLSVGGTTMKVWDHFRWMCVHTIDITAVSDTVPPRGLPPGMVVPTQSIVARSVGEGMTMVNASVQLVTSSMYAEGSDRHPPGSHEPKGAAATQLGLKPAGPGRVPVPTVTVAAAVAPGESVHELPSTIMEDLGGMPSLALSVNKSMWGTESTDGEPPRVTTPGDKAPQAVGGVSTSRSVTSPDSPARMRGVPPRFPHPAGTHTDAASAVNDSKRRTLGVIGGAGDMPVGVLTYESMELVQPRPKIAPITDSDFRTAMVVEVRGMVALVAAFPCA